MNIHPDRMAGAATAASELLKALSNPHRLVILCHVLERERSVGELAELLKLRESTVSQHLALLRREELVVTRRDGQTIWYSLGSRPVRSIIEALYGIYCGPAGKSSRSRQRPI